MDLAGNNLLFPDNPSFALPPMETGDRSAGSGMTTAPFVPPVLLKAISYIESGWAQASYDPLVQYGETGPVLVSADCGYGLMQVTSGMQNVSGFPNMDQTMIGGHYAFNIARGAQILAQKWNDAPEFRPIVGGRDPHIIENWYFALWAYNGFAFRNHPFNAGYDPNRPPYDCQPGTPRNYPYQELILGCVAHPPMRDGVPLWPAQPVTLPNLSDPAFAGPLNVNNWNACSAELQCASMDIPTPSDSHTDGSQPAIDRTTLLGLPLTDPEPNFVELNLSSTTAQTSLTIANPASGLLAWRAQSSQPWLTVSRYQGISMPGAGYSTPLTLIMDVTGQPDADSTAAVTIESQWSANTTVVVTVIVHPPRLTCDGVLTVLDALAILNNISGIGGCVSDVGDANCDGHVDAQDAVLVLEYLIGLPSRLPESCQSALKP
jgi:hypothetical protein